MSILAHVLATQAAERSARLITAEEQAECIALAEINEERASACTPAQDALRKTLELNAELLRKLADTPKVHA